MHSALISSPPIYIPVQRLPYVTEDSPIYGTGGTGAFMVFGGAWLDDLHLDECPTVPDMQPFDDEDAPFTDVDVVDEVIEADFLSIMDEIDAALDALFAEAVDSTDSTDDRMYLIDRDGNRRYFDSGTALHAAARSLPRPRVH